MAPTGKRDEEKSTCLCSDVLGSINSASSQQTTARDFIVLQAISDLLTHLLAAFTPDGNIASNVLSQLLSEIVDSWGKKL